MEIETLFILVIDKTSVLEIGSGIYYMFNKHWTLILYQALL